MIKETVNELVTRGLEVQKYEDHQAQQQLKELELTEKRIKQQLEEPELLDNYTEMLHNYFEARMKVAFKILERQKREA